MAGVVLVLVRRDGPAVKAVQVDLLIYCPGRRTEKGHSAAVRSPHFPLVSEVPLLVNICASMGNTTNHTSRPHLPDVRGWRTTRSIGTLAFSGVYNLFEGLGMGAHTHRNT